MAFHLEDGGLAVTDIDDTGILARPLDHLLAGDRKLAQMRARGFVGTVLGPHDRENAQLHQVRRPAQTVQDDLVFGVDDAVFLDDLGGDAFGVLGHGGYALPRRDSNSFSPSVPPCFSSTARSGWGIMPMTLPCSLVMPAMSRAEPLGLLP